MGKIAFLFAGQGAQSVGMGADLYEDNEAAKAVFDMGEAKRAGTLDQTFRSDMETLTKTENTQPCLFLMDLACARALEAEGIKADFAAGFSLGEIPALAYAGVLTDEEAFDLVCVRGNKMAECAKAHPGSMAAVLRLTAETVEEIAGAYKEVWPVNYNCPGQTVCAGSSEEIGPFSDAVKEKGGKALPLKVSGAFHTPYMEAAGTALKEKLDTLDVKAPSLPIISNTTAEPYGSDRDGITGLISGQCANPVRWEATIRYMYAQGVDTFIEVGAGKTLSGLVNKTLTDVKIFNVCDKETLKAVAFELSHEA